MNALFSKRAACAIFLGCAVAGTLDIGAACALAALRHMPPAAILQAIASGVLGASAFRGGAATAALGLGLHFLIMLGIAAVYWAALSRRQPLLQRPLLAGAMFGAAVYLVMNALVLPLSVIPFVPKYSLAIVLRDVAIHIVMVGLPIAFIARAAVRRRAA